MHFHSDVSDGCQSIVYTVSPNDQLESHNIAVISPMVDNGLFALSQTMISRYNGISIMQCIAIFRVPIVASDHISIIQCRHIEDSNWCLNHILLASDISNSCK